MYQLIFILNRMGISKAEESARLLFSQLKSDSRASSEIARMAGVSQPTVSRMRLSNGKRFRVSIPFNKLCSFYGIPVADTVKVTSGYNELLCKAIIDAWDGTESHGRALLMVVKSLKGLGAKADNDVGGLA